MKAVLVLDEMPSRCNECICKFATITGKMICRYAKKELKPKRDKPSWCPLKSMPSKKQEKQYCSNGVFGINTAMKTRFNQGYNACIDEILGDKE